MLHLKRNFIFGVVGVLLLSGCLPALAPIPLPAPAAVRAATSPTPVLTTTPLCTILIDLAEPRDIGSGQLGVRYVSDFTGGTVSGDQVNDQLPRVADLPAEALRMGVRWRMPLGPHVLPAFSPRGPGILVVEEDHEMATTAPLLMLSNAVEQACDPIDDCLGTAWYLKRRKIYVSFNPFVNNLGAGGVDPQRVPADPARSDRAGSCGQTGWPHIDQIETLVKGIMDAKQVPGVAVGIVKAGELVYAKGFGVAALGRDRPVTTNTCFPCFCL